MLAGKVLYKPCTILPGRVISTMSSLSVTTKEEDGEWVCPPQVFAREEHPTLPNAQQTAVSYLHHHMLQYSIMLLCWVRGFFCNTLPWVVKDIISSFCSSLYASFYCAPYQLTQLLPLRPGVSCDPGWYFDLSELVCEMCPNGTYSLGGGVHYETWEHFPEGFNSYTEAFRSAFTLGRRHGEVDCSE